MTGIKREISTTVCFFVPIGGKVNECSAIQRVTPEGDTSVSIRLDFNVAWSMQGGTFADVSEQREQIITKLMNGYHSTVPDDAQMPAFLATVAARQETHAVREKILAAIELGFNYTLGYKHQQLEVLSNLFGDTWRKQVPSKPSPKMVEVSAIVDAVIAELREIGC